VTQRVVKGIACGRRSDSGTEDHWIGADCVILDCQDDFTGPTRPELGYKRFRRIWENETR
jgi:hypothetical protein